MLPTTAMLPAFSIRLMILNSVGVPKAFRRNALSGGVACCCPVWWSTAALCGSLLLPPGRCGGLLCDVRSAERSQPLAHDVQTLVPASIWLHC